MGTNVSRHHEKGLSGRRTQSSDNIKADPTLNHNNNNINATINNVTTKLLPPENYVSKKDRNKFCGSLPNHLDADDACENMFQHQNVAGENTTINSDIESIEYISVTPKITPHYHQQPPPPTYQQSSPFYSSSSGKGSTISTNNLGGSTFKSNSENKPDIQLKLPLLLRTNIDAGCDQGYGSEKSPEDELPPPLHLVHDGQYKEILSSSHMPPHSVIQPNDMQQYWNYEKSNICGDYNFITKESIFFVQITKGPRGLGLSVSGGTDSNAAFPGLIRIKRLFPHQAAWATGMLQPGDILLAANGISLSGLTNYEALEVLRTVPNFVTLTVCRPLDEQYRKLSPPSEPPKPPMRTSVQQYLYHPLPYLQPIEPLQTNFSGEFEIILTKQQGSLGFTLRKEDNSILGHFVRALVREPATTDGRIRPGDRIMAVNDVPISNFTHEQAVIFLRQAADVVKLRLYRDIASTPISAHSPIDHEQKGFFCSENNSFSKPKPNLRPEAINLLTDIAYRKQTPNGDDSTNSSVKSNSTSPRRLRRVHNKSSDNQSYSNYSEGSTATYSDSDTSTIISQGNSYQMQPISSSSSSCCNNHPPYQMDVLCDNDNPEAYYCDNELLELCGEDGCSMNGDLQNRPNYLNLAGESGHTPMSSRKPRFPFTVAKANAYELNNLDNETLDAPTMYTLNNHLTGPEPNDFTSLPCETYLVACKTESDLHHEDSCDAIYVKHFNHKSPLYSSVNVQLKDNSTVSDVVDAVQKEGTKSLMKWKGVTLSPEHGPEEDKTVTPADESSCAATMGTSTTTDTIRDLDSYDCGTDSEGNEIFTIELNRGWNSRLGFSLQQDAAKKTFVSAIYSDSVAARDGRLNVGDQVLMVNDESVENLTTNQIIDILRIIRGSICITLMRKLPKNIENVNEYSDETNEN